ncbi:hypothetical protein GT347_02900 [Xylophilus rhododendri]|uniref:Uncharacterized protein n=1 Tax=Xylophilus rhododendri TaxID=2697032 RepID=A0A857J193_9BURK|nr:hypothetical protein [Xylophilus rhododendri]QHI97023.1 hypothetical protein GT347_02900 [Xylophilus rhododendri]
MAYGLDAPAVQTMAVSLAEGESAPDDQRLLQNAWQHAQRRYSDSGGAAQAPAPVFLPALRRKLPAMLSARVAAGPGTDSLEPADRLVTNLVHVFSGLLLQDLELELPDAQDSLYRAAQKDLRIAAAAYILDVAVPERLGCRATAERSRHHRADLIFVRRPGTVAGLAEDIHDGLVACTRDDPPEFATAQQTDTALATFTEYVEQCLDRIDGMGSAQYPFCTPPAAAATR